jgi:hypothetical protein
LERLVGYEMDRRQYNKECEASTIWERLVAKEMDCRLYKECEASTVWETSS